MVFRKAVPEDLDAVEQSYLEFLAQEQQTGPWTVWKLGVYPTRQTAEESLAQGTLYVMEDEEGFAASVTLDRRQPAEYAGIPWEYPAGPEEALVIHTLCIRPARGGRGLGKKLVACILEEAGRLGCRAVRLDTGAQNKPAVGLYTKMGFRLAASGTILLDGQIAHKDHVFMEHRVGKGASGGAAFGG